MLTSGNYYKSLLYLTYAVIRSDGVVGSDESEAVEKLHQFEKIPQDVHSSFNDEIKNLDYNQICKNGLESLKKCSSEEQGKVLGWIYSLVEVDDSVDVREARFLLYAINSSDFSLEEVIEISKSLPKIA